MTFDLKNVAIVYNPDISGAKDFADLIAKKFELSEIFNVENINLNENTQYSLAISIGGDGTLLRCANVCASKNIKILGFNLGRLGYLAQAKTQNLCEIVEKIKKGDFRVEKRLLLKCFANGKNLIALNDFVIKGATFSRTSTIDLQINDILVSKYLADGLIISTPTGSTAYTLSAGGPVLTPNLNAITIVPICPHTLSARPLVIPSSEKIKVLFSDCAKFYIASDGQVPQEVKNEVIIEKSEHQAQLILLNKDENDFYNVLREKLHWGQKIDK